jgi:small-conductance mechanosensitive channel
MNVKDTHTTTIINTENKPLTVPNSQLTDSSQQLLNYTHEAELTLFQIHYYS